MVVAAMMVDSANVRNIVDHFVYEKDRKILTEKELGLVGLRTIGHATVKNAFPPLHMHIHKDCIEIVTVVKGRQTYISDGVSHRLTGGDVFLSFLDQPHGSGENLQDINEILWMQIDMTYRDGFLGLHSVLGKTLHDRLQSISDPVSAIDRASINILIRAFESLSRLTRDDIQAGQSLLVTFLNRLSRSRGRSEEMEYCFKEVLRYIDENHNEPIAISTLSRMCNLSESRFKHKFTEIIGISPKQYINARRIDTAGELLRNLPASEASNVTDVAMMCGFASANYFSTVFKKYTGCTPTQAIHKYRESKESS
jgi:AraC-like DNA-binding protein